MTVPNENYKKIYTGSGGTSFPYDFYIFEDSDLQVVKKEIATGTETILALTTDYTVSGAGVVTGGTVTTLAAVTSAYQIIITRALDYTQEIDFIKNEKLPAETIEQGLDRLTMLCLQIKEFMDRAVLAPSTLSANLVLPALVANKVLTNDGTSLIWDDLVVTETTYLGTFSHGLDAAKPAAPEVGDIYNATNTYKLYMCYSVGVWTEYTTSINGLTVTTAMANADIMMLEQSPSWVKRKITWANMVASISNLTKVKASSGDASPDYLDGKVDNVTVRVSANKLALTAAYQNAVLSRMVDKLPEPSGSIEASACIMEDGTLRVWGDDAKIGTGASTGDRWLPTLAGFPITMTENITKVYLSHSNIYALTTSGQVWATGANASGQLGDGTTVAKSLFQRVGTLTGITKLAIPRDAVAAGVTVYALNATTGALYAWGANASGQCGDGTTTDVTSPFTVPGVWKDIACAGGTTNYIHAIAIDSLDEVYCCGENAAGQCGTGGTTDLTTFTKVAGLSNITKVWASGDGASGSCYALESGGQLYAWGDNAYGQLCDGTTTDRLTPQAIASLTTVADLAVSGGVATWCCAILADQTVRTWGSNGVGQLGDNSTTDRSTVFNPSLAGITKAICYGTAAASGNIALLKSDGTIYVSGYNATGSLGVGDATARDQFESPIGYMKSKAVDISHVGSSTYQNLMILHSDGTLMMCGYNNLGELGVGNTTGANIMVKTIF